MPKNGKAHPDVLGALRKEGKDYVLPSSAWYATPEQVSAYLKLANSNEYKESVHAPEWELINDFLETELPWTEKAYHVVDLGSGDGEKGVKFVKRIKELGSDASYHPLDSSGEMLSVADKKARDSGADSFPIHDDLVSLANAKQHLSHFSGKKIFLLLGNTFGNFDPDTLLKNISGLMGEGDLLLVGTGLVDGSPEEIERAYSDPKITNLMHATARALGLGRDDYEVVPKFNGKKRALEIFLNMKKDKSVSDGNHELRFKKGDRIRAAISHKYGTETIMPILRRHLAPLTTYFHDRKQYTLAVAKKRASGRFGVARMGFDSKGNLVLEGGEELFRPSVSGTRKPNSVVRNGYPERRTRKKH